MKTLVHCLRDERYKLAAACAILDRGYGKPVQSVHAQSEHTVLHLIAAQAISEELHLSIQEPVDTVDAKPARLVDASEQPTE